MVLGIDASNIKTGGGFTHLKELLLIADPNKFGFNKVIVYGGGQIKQLPSRQWLEIRVVKSLETPSLAKEMLWRMFDLPKLAARECDLLFSPGGIFSSSLIPYVSMSQNMLIWEEKESSRFGIADRMKLKLLRFLQNKSFEKSKGVIYISQYAKNYIETISPGLKSLPSTVIYHGINERFRRPPEVKNIEKKSVISVLYVSMIHHYKFQWNVIDAIKKIRDDSGLNIKLDLVGGAKPSVLAAMQEQLKETKDFVTHHGKVPYATIEKLYHEADCFVFASTCENMPNILIEAMSSGLPIASSNYGPMPEILRDGGTYFDPEKVEEIIGAVNEILLNATRRIQMQKRSYLHSQEYQWSTAADQTFEFLKRCAQ